MTSTGREQRRKTQKTCSIPRRKSNRTPGESNAGRIAGRLNGGLAVAGIAYDIYNGKPVDRAIVSGGLGFGASVLAGAAAVADTGAAIGELATGVWDAIF
ncbi:hypothetical protein C5142_23250 [Rhodococcus sp. BGS-1C]|uniref:hypothetical protein n=1 Tax=unclassified Rhodococcus (in: high G+C Gram-positive bacteria) TaxID=192944 RepID=UPI0019D1D67A|nr:hypothetical protein [Rhodococcus sp. KRD197]